jgi:hypothetical protein
MVHCGDTPSLTQKARTTCYVIHFRRQDLQSYHPAELSILRPVHKSHAAVADLL